ncbi:MAG: hypothetical protein J5I94_22630 [Phaeodactylibacter sp.]|nr:hypothetical protein [Phaeodactylibacter sp.]
MKNYLLLLFFLPALLGCRNETQTGNADTVEQAPSQPQNPSPGRQEQKAQATAQKQREEPVVSSRPAYEPPRSRDVLTIIAQDTRARSGSEVCVAVKVKGFTNLLALQYTLSWDPKVLEFKGVDKPGLPYLDNADFGFNRVKEGLLPFVWINDALQATTIPDEAVIYEVCFRAIGTAGLSSAIRFVQQPTPFEVVNIQEEIQELRPVEGKVAVE